MSIKMNEWMNKLNNEWINEEWMTNKWMNKHTWKNNFHIFMHKMFSVLKEVSLFYLAKLIIMHVEKTN